MNAGWPNRMLQAKACPQPGFFWKFADLSSQHAIQRSRTTRRISGGMGDCRRPKQLFPKSEHLYGCPISAIHVCSKIKVGF